MRRDRGQSTVELALSLPLVLVVLLGAVQITIVVLAQLAITHAAHEAARAASVAADAAGAAGSAARSALALPGLSVDTTTGDGRVRVRLRADVPTDVPLVGALVGDVRVHAAASMPLEE